MATLGPQIVTGSYGGLLKFLPIGEDGISNSQIQISDGSGKVTPLYLATGSVFVDSEFSASGDVIFDGLSTTGQANFVSIDASTGRLYYATTSSIQLVVSSSYSISSSRSDSTVSASYALSSSWAHR